MRLTEAEQKSFRKMFVYLEYCLHVLRGKLGMPQPKVPPQPVELVGELLDCLEEFRTCRCARDSDEPCNVCTLCGHAELWLAEQEEVSGG